MLNFHSERFDGHALHFLEGIGIPGAEDVASEVGAAFPATGRQNERGACCAEGAQ